MVLKCPLGTKLLFPSVHISVEATQYTWLLYLCINQSGVVMWPFNSPLYFPLLHICSLICWKRNENQLIKGSIYSSITLAGYSVHSYFILLSLHIIEITAISQNYIHENIKRKFKSENVCYHSLQIFSSCILY